MLHSGAHSPTIHLIGWHLSVPSHYSTFAHTTGSRVERISTMGRLHGMVSGSMVVIVRVVDVGLSEATATMAAVTAAPPVL